MADTFQSIWGEVLLYAPDTPLPLAKKFVRDAYRRATDRFSWSAQRAESAFIVPTPYTTGTADVTQSSLTVTGTGTTWTSDMAGRQFILGGQAPYYTIASVETVTSLTLDRVYAGTSATGQTYEISQVYLLAPADTIRLDSVIDPQNWWRLNLNWTQEALDRIDPKRAYSSAGSSPRILATATFTTAGVPRYELWPRPTSARSYPIRYTRRLADLSNPSDTPIQQIRGDALRYGALAQLTMWPGTTDAPNPLHDLNLHREYEMLFQKELDYLERQDQEIRMDSLWYESMSAMPFAPIDARWIQAHAPY